MIRLKGETVFISAGILGGGEGFIFSLSVIYSPLLPEDKSQLVFLTNICRQDILRASTSDLYLREPFILCNSSSTHLSIHLPRGEVFWFGSVICQELQHKSIFTSPLGLRADPVLLLLL